MRPFICKYITRKTVEVDSESVSDNSRTSRKTKKKLNHKKDLILKELNIKTRVPVRGM